ncbi:hypothetical protein V7S43_000961 [Phytophthora oleae]
MELLVAGIRRHLEGEWALLGPTAASMTLGWGSDERLRLPRMVDSLFGVSVSFPLIESDEEQQHEEWCNNEAVVESEHYEQEATDGLPSPDKAVVMESKLDNTFENNPPADASQVVGAQASQGTDIEAVAARGISSDISRRDACVSAVEIRGIELQAESPVTQRQADNVDRAPLEQNKDANTQLDSSLESVNEILVTHSRADILLELEWARQALRNRRKYLRSTRCVVERRLDQYAYA